MSTLNWPPALLDLPESVWQVHDGIPTTRIRINGCALIVRGLQVAWVDGVQTAVTDTERENHLVELYDPGDPWQTWSGFGAEYALYATPAEDQDAPVVADLELDRPVWSGFAPEFEERDRKLFTLVVRGHCSLHVDARRVTAPGQEFVDYPEDRDALAALAGWDGPYPTVRIDGDEYVVFAYPHGD